MLHGEGSASSVAGDNHVDQVLAAAHEPLAARSDALSAPAVRSSRKRPAAALEGDNEQQVSSGDQQKAAEPAGGTIAPCPPPRRQPVRRLLHDSALSSNGCSRAPGTAEVPELQQALESTARRILPFTECDFEPSPPPMLLKALSDHDLVVARAAVWRVAAEQEPPPSGLARFRLLAWTVADARGALLPLPKRTAEKAGKRLEAQALNVLSSTEDKARCARLEAMGAAAADAALRPGLEAELAAIDEALQLAVEASKLEEYVGFYELVPPPPPPPPPQPPPQPEPPPPRSQSDVPEAGSVPAASPATETKPAHRACPSREGRVVQFPWLLEMDVKTREPVPIPPDLAAALGPEAVQVFLAEQSGYGYGASATWWSVALPHFAKRLLDKLAEEREDHRAELRDERERLHSERQAYIELLGRRGRRP
jgi:hypothetical protein